MHEADNAAPLDPVISAYSRNQAIDDGFLVDVSDTAREAGFSIPVALTRTAYAMGMTRLSCVFCIMASRADLRTAARLQPGLYRTYARLEQDLDHTLSPSRIPLPELTGIPIP